MKEVFLITAYCETEEKKNYLKKCLSELKRFNIDICLYSHYFVDEEFQKEVNYCIYDESNPILNLKEHNKGITQWQEHPISNKKIDVIRDDYGYAVMNQWKRGIDFLLNIGYERFFVVNFDVFLTDNVFNKNKEYLNTFDAVCYYWGTHRSFELNSLFISFNKVFAKVFIDSLTKEDYINNINTMLETYLMRKIDALLSQFKIKKLEFHEYGGIEDTEKSEIIHTIHFPDPYKNHEFMSIFGGINKDTNFFDIYLFNISGVINKFEFIASDKEQRIIYKPETKDNFFYISTSLNKEELDNSIKDNKLKILINDKEIDQSIYKKFLTSLIRDMK